MPQAVGQPPVNRKKDTAAAQAEATTPASAPPTPKPDPSPDASDPKYSGLAGRGKFNVDMLAWKNRNPESKKGTSGAEAAKNIEGARKATKETKKVWNPEKGRYDDSQVEVKPKK